MESWKKLSQTRQGILILVVKGDETSFSKLDLLP